MKYNPNDPWEIWRKTAVTLLVDIIVWTMAASGLVFLITRDKVLTGLLLPWIALAITIVWSVWMAHILRTTGTRRMKKT